MLLERMCDAFNEAEVPFALVGGFAVALLGAPRGTVDVDCVIRHTQQDFEACERALRSIGLRPRLPVTAKEVFQFREEYIRRRNLIAWSFVNPSNPIEVVDIIITHDLRSLSVERKRFGIRSVPVLSVEDLIAMKKQSGRSQDLEDIKALRRLEREKEKNGYTSSPHSAGEQVHAFRTGTRRCHSDRGVLGDVS